MMKITKSSGSSVTNAQQFREMERIIENDSVRRSVVVSTSGHKHKKDNKVTDLLYLIEAHLEYSVGRLSLLHLVEERFISTKNDLGLSYPIKKDLARLKGQLNKTVSVDYLVSRGEYLTVKLMAEYLDFLFVDTEDIITFRYDGKIDFDATKHRMDNTMKGLDRFVIPDFYGALPDGTVRMISRGGSDIMGSILADILNVDMYENWVDVSDILTADPKIVHHPRRIDTITYSKLCELSCMGVSVLREEAISSIKEKNILINILSTNHPEEGGTITMEKSDYPSEQMVTGTAGKKNFIAIAVYKSHMLNEVGTIHRALEVCENYRIGIEHIPGGIDSSSIVVNFEDVKDIIYDMVGDMKKACNADETKIIDNISLIATAGRQMMYCPGISGKLFAVLEKNSIGVCTITQGTDGMSIVVGAESEDYERIVKTIYNNFVVQTHRMLHNSYTQNTQIEYEERVK